MDQNAVVVPWVTAGYLAFSAIAILVVTLVGYRLLRKVGRLVFGPDAVFGTDARTRLIAFGLAALAFPTVVPWVVYVIAWSCIAVFSDIPRALLNNWMRTSEMCRTMEFGPCLGQAGFGFLQAMGTGMSDAYRTASISDFPYRDSIFLVTVWAVLAQILSTVDGADAGERRFRLHAAYGRLSPAGRQNFHFFVVLAVAGYLSVASIAAIPSLQDDTRAGNQITVEQLNKEIAEDLRRVAVTNLDAINPFEAIDDVLKSPSNVPAGAGDAAVEQPAARLQPVAQASVASGPSLEERRTRLTELVAPLRQQRQELLRASEQLRRTDQEQVAKSRESAKTIYSVSIDRKGARERTQHFADIVAWYRDRLVTMNEAEDNCQQSIIRADASFTAWSKLFASSVVQSAETPLNDPTLRAVSSGEGLGRGYLDARDACQPVVLTQGVPARPQLGSFLGPFGLVASWLVRTESLPLTLIVGLLGFGLLGSACSTFVREQAIAPVASVNGALIADLPGVVIRGLSAAIVVFLAVEGGLAIFSSGSADPNPYVLLLTCLVAAVFSEDVWAWAHKKLRDSFSGDAPHSGTAM